tara:strand:- start:308 stop:1069 length:762 start_codon:yes stop_codon:yes gene_type:complete
MPEVSVIIPTINRRTLLNQSIKSVINQNYNNWELFIVNDSTDDILLNQSDSRIHLVENQLLPGANGARNTGINLSVGKYIAFLDDDDTWDSNKLSKQVEIMKSTGAILCYTGKNIIFRKKKFIKNKCSYYTTILNPFVTLQIHNYIGTTSSIMVKSEILKNKVKFDENIHSLQDYDLYLQLAKLGEIIGTSENLVTYNFDGDTNHTSKRKKAFFSSAIQINKKQKGIYRLTILFGLIITLMQKIYKYFQYKLL